MFFKKENKLTLEEIRRQEKLTEIQLAQYEIEELAEKIHAINKVISVLPDGADKDAEIKFCEQQKFSLLCAIGSYDMARQEYLLLCGNGISFPSSHEVLRSFFQRTP